jgi:uncharacterized membrane protein
MPLAISDYVPQVAAAGARERRRAAWVWAGAVAFGLVVVALVVAAPWLAAGGHGVMARGVYRGFAVACHQMPERSFHLFGHPLAVCARCAGLYAGFALGLLAYPLARPLASRRAPARAWLVAAALPAAADFTLGFAGLWENTHPSRALTGALLGAVAALYVVPGRVDLSHTARAAVARRARTTAGG